MAREDVEVFQSPDIGLHGRGGDAARQDAAEIRETSRKETSRLEAEIMAEARESADGMSASGREAIERALKDLKAGLDQPSKELSALVSKSILGRDLS